MESVIGSSDLTDIEVEGLKDMKALVQEFLESGEGGKQVREFITNANADEKILMRFLRGRKNRPKHAWDTLKRNAEVRYETYPELYPDSLSKAVLTLIESEAFGILKARDSMGRIIGFFDTSKWDPNKVTLEDLNIVACLFIDGILDKAASSGVVFIQECSGMSMKHAQHYTLPAILRFINVFWYSYPVQLKGVWYVNVPPLLTFVYRFGKHLLPKKLKERLILSSTSKEFTILHEKLSPDILPKCLGGKLEFADATDGDIFKSRMNPNM